MRGGSSMVSPSGGGVNYLTPPAIKNYPSELRENTENKAVRKAFSPL